MRIVPLLLLFALLAGCSVQKRKYMKGYYVDRQGAVKRTQAITAEKRSYAPVLVSAAKSNEQVVEAAPVPPDSCDLITMLDGKVERARVMEVTPTEIRYKSCTYLAGPVYVVYRNKVSHITYPNGERYDVTPQPPAVPSQREPAQEPASIGPPALPPPPPPYVERTTDPGAVAALILIFLGVLVFLVLSMLGGVLLYVVSLTLAIGALNRIGRNPRTLKGKGTATVAIVFALLALFISIMFVVSVL